MHKKISFIKYECVLGICIYNNNNVYYPLIDDTIYILVRRRPHH